MSTINKPKIQQEKQLYNPTTSTRSPSSKSAELISASGSSLSPSTIKAGPKNTAPLPFFPFFVGDEGYLLDRPARLRNALRMTLHLVVGRTVRAMSLLTAERKVNFILSSSSSSSEPASEGASDSAVGEIAREGDARSASGSGVSLR